MPLVYKFKLKPAEKKKKDYITEDELKEIVEMGMSFCEQIDPYKLEVIMYFLFYTGIRRGEFLNLKRSDFDLPSNKAKIRIPTKNREERWIYFPKELTTIIENYFNVDAEEYNAFNMTEAQLVFLMKQLKEFLKGKNLTPHSLRHSFARMLAEKEVDIKTAQKLLGHKNLATTEIYFDPDDRIVEKNYRSKVKIKIKGGK
jgi:integrase